MRIFIEAARSGEPGGFSLVESFFNRAAHTYTDLTEQSRFAEWNTRTGRSPRLFLWKTVPLRWKAFRWQLRVLFTSFLLQRVRLTPAARPSITFTNVTIQLYFLLQLFTVSINFFSVKTDSLCPTIWMYSITLWNTRMNQLKIDEKENSNIWFLLVGPQNQLTVVFVD